MLYEVFFVSFKVFFNFQSQECKRLEEEVDKGIAKMVASEDKMSRLESDLALISDQEKSIVNQLTHIDSSKQKLKTIIENTTEGDVDGVDEKKKQYVLNFCNIS